jgi:hypothetical protein
VTLEGDGSNALSAYLYDSNTPYGTPEISLSMNERVSGVFNTFKDTIFDPPMLFETGLTSNIVGNGGTARIYGTYL